MPPPEILVELVLWWNPSKGILNSFTGAYKVLPELRVTAFKLMKMQIKVPYLKVTNHFCLYDQMTIMILFSQIVFFVAI